VELDASFPRLIPKPLGGLDSDGYNFVIVELSPSAFKKLKVDTIPS
jgi:hypothetical protein